MAKTATGDFPIGFRLPGGDWVKPHKNAAAFAVENDFDFLDLRISSADELKEVTDTGCDVGSVDMIRWMDLISADAGKRKAAVQENIEFIKSVVAAGPNIFFVVLLPGDPDRSRSENFELAVESYSELAESIADTGAKIVIEGYPGPWPKFPALACTPEGYRAIIKQVPGNVVGVNYDPSHLIRMGIDAKRFLEEFVEHVYHVHAKDTELLSDGLYEFGNLQMATFTKPRGFGAFHWRYTIPGYGEARWGELFAILESAGYQGKVSIELEDERYNGTEQGEKDGLIASRDYLTSI